jgi:hypothetical protein
VTPATAQPSGILLHFIQCEVQLDLLASQTRTNRACRYAPDRREWWHIGVTDFASCSFSICCGCECLLGSVAFRRDCQSGPALTVQTTVQLMSAGTGVHSGSAGEHETRMETGLGIQTSRRPYPTPPTPHLAVREFPSIFTPWQATSPGRSSPRSTLETPRMSSPSHQCGRSSVPKCADSIAEFSLRWVRVGG